MQQYSAIDGIVGDWHLVHLGSRAVGGAGLIITESTAVSPQGRSTGYDAGLWDDGQIEPWRKITSFVKAQGTKIAVQLGHFGSKASRSHPNEGLQYLQLQQGGWQTVSSSAVAPFNGMSLPEELTEAGIKAVQKQYVEAARRALEAGFDCIEIHAAHGYLFHQFYSSLINHRTDNYGGSFDNRIRFLMETVRAIRRQIPESMPLLVRISAVDYLDTEAHSWKIEDAVRLAEALKSEGVDFITASAGGFVFLDKTNVYPSYQVPFASAIKEASGVPTGAVGMITEPGQANDIISSGKADAVVIAREFLRNPYFPIQAARQLGIALPVPFQYKRAY
jgi:2,4-dienoyl-CoA reductase-like NADH-dependent reductase (Old Yellow Enzyme family)